MRLLRRFFASCGAPGPQRAQPLREGGAAPDESLAAEASHRIGEQLERARRDARARTLRVTTLPLSFGAVLSVLGAQLDL
jgi:hypothetical protein